MNILGLIPARGGSKRIPGKNVKLLGDLPLIARTIQAAIASTTCSDIVVSTDDTEIADIARKFGATIPGLRPPHLATDEATSVDVALYELDRHEKAHGPVDGLLLLQPTSPFRTAESIKKAVTLFEMSQGCHAVVSVSKAPVHPAWCFRLNKSGMEPYLGRDNLERRSQDLESAYSLNGAIYLISPLQLQNGHSFLPKSAVPFVMESIHEALDIDTEDDWMMAEFFINFMNSKF
ncbi:MAG: acylneuraminate cytidylyltransferase family protein [Desulfomicrobium sp.]|nr:acylneuraminate cytidylyltransferase family protein [Pseudomonadota bacterium]MBV1711915.1 acylneuraminate cytidylyltransferase family protein [Desulfomicrobium sp.]MBU4571092.1 acylneuraminate cytidylyltransferase family protein [Pseudomonadota bacterium]MBU4593721.1 acylneuraminate cytidylyltransferase family protein [Pseudomonadota bacterium]MBV1719023.1 acylneuraminate cytidylyltransferase family protein [Desulfomicrobium sp.]